MERPQIKDKKILEYVERLEQELMNFKSETTTAKSYLALQHFIDESNRVIKEHKFRAVDLSDKDEKIHDRVAKYIDNVLSLNKNLKELEKMVNPEVLEQVKQESGGLLEDVLRDGNK